MIIQPSELSPTVSTELFVADIPNAYRNFADAIGQAAWERRVRCIKSEIRGNSLLAEYLQAENEIAFALVRCGDLIDKYGNLQHIGEEMSIYSAIGVAVQTLSLMRTSTRVEAEKLRKRVKGAFANPDDMRAYQLELATATHFARLDWKVVWPEMMGEGETFDLFVTSPMGTQLEVECKSISNNKGRSIHQREAWDFLHLVAKEVASLKRTLKVGVSVVLTVPLKLPSLVFDRQTLAKRIRQQILIGSSATLSDGTEIRIGEFDANTTLNPYHRGDQAMRVALDTVTGTQNRAGILEISAHGGAIAVVLQSTIKDDPINHIFETLGKAAKRQLTKRRGGLLVAGLANVERDVLLANAGKAQDTRRTPTVLEIGVTDFLSSTSRNHIIGVAFFSRGDVRSAAKGVFESGGAAHFFPRREGSNWHADFDGIFI